MRNVRLTLCLLTLALFSTPIMALCGDCDGSGGIDILDALTAAQIDAGVIPLTSAHRQDCDVDNDMDVDKADAQLIAEKAAGLPTTLVCPTNLLSLNPAVGYCVTGNLSDGNPWDILVEDEDFGSGATFTDVPPAYMAETQIVTVASPWPAADPLSTSQAFSRAINNNTRIFPDLLNPGSTASFVAAPITWAGMQCFTPRAQSTAGTTHFASVGLKYDDGTTCYPDTGAACPIP